LGKEEGIMENQEKDICTLRSFERNRYFYGKLLSVRDFEAEQSYLRGKDAIQNKLIHGVGIVCGLEVSYEDEGKIRLEVSSGVAIDCCGREIVLSEPAFVGADRFNDDLNYLYLRYDECLNERVPCIVNASTCEEKCDYSRIKETYDFFVSADKGTISGTITEAGTGADEVVPIEGAVVEVLQLDRAVKGYAETDANGSYNTSAPAGTYLVQASASGFEPETEEPPWSDFEVVTIEVGQDVAVALSLKKIAESAKPKSLAELTLDHCKKYLGACSQCNDPKNAMVFIAVVERNADGTISVNKAETDKHRIVVPNNPMLYRLLGIHIADLNNPHKTTAEQVGALVSVDGVDNPGGDVDLIPTDAITIAPDNGANTITIGEDHSGDTDNPHQTTAEQVKALESINDVGNDGVKPHVSNVDLVSDDPDPSITIDPNISANEIKLTTSAEQVKALKSINDVGNVEDAETYVSNINLVSPDNTVDIDPVAPENNDPKISLKIIPAEVSDIESVNKAKDAGASSNFARGDHVHDLAQGVVTEDKIDDDAVTGPKIDRTALQPGYGIVITDPGGGNFKFFADLENNADNIESVGTPKSAGSSTYLARANHVHDLGSGVVKNDHVSDDDADRIVESKIAFHTGAGHDHDGLNSKKVDALVSVDGVEGDPDNGNIDLVEGDNVKIEPDQDSNSIRISAAGGMGLETDLTRLESVGWTHGGGMTVAQFMDIITGNNGLRVNFIRDGSPAPVGLGNIPNEVFLVAVKTPLLHWDNMIKTYHYEYLPGSVSLENNGTAASFRLDSPNIDSYRDYLQQMLQSENQLTILVQLKCDFIRDIRYDEDEQQVVGKAVDGSHATRIGASGLIWDDGNYVGGIRGRLFESWFRISDSDVLPEIVSTEPPEGSNVDAVAQVTAVLEDNSGMGMDLDASTIRLESPDGAEVSGVQTDDDVSTIVWKLTDPLPTDGTADGTYTIVVNAVDKAGGVTEGSSTFWYGTKANLPVINVSGVGPSTNEALNSLGITTVGDLASSTVDALRAGGISESRASEIIAEAKRMLGTD
jgi:hypothetical protein